MSTTLPYTTPPAGTFPQRIAAWGCWGATHSSANFTLEMLASTSYGVTSPITTTFFFSKSTSNDVTPAQKRKKKKEEQVNCWDLFFSFSSLSRKQSRLQASTKCNRSATARARNVPVPLQEKKKGNCNLYGRTAVGRGSGGGGHGRGAFSVSATKSWPPPACLSRAKFSFPESSNKKKRGAGSRHHQSTTHIHKQAAAEPAACRTCACAQCKTCAGRAGRHACLPIAQAQPIRHDANSDSRAAGDRLIDHWSWRGSPAALVSLHCSTLSASNPESFVHMELY